MFVTNHHMSQAIFRSFSRLELLKVNVINLFNFIYAMFNFILYFLNVLLTYVLHEPRLLRPDLHHIQ